MRWPTTSPADRQSHRCPTADGSEWPNHRPTDRQSTAVEWAHHLNPLNLMGRRSKYCPEVVDRITGAIAETGRDCDGYRAGPIGHETFHRWLSEFREFREAVQAARDHYRATSLPQQRQWARIGLSRTLQAVAEGQELVATTTEETINPRTGEIVTLTTVKRQPAIIPIGQAFSYVMGREVDLLIWVRQGVELGVLPLAFVEEITADVDGVTARIRERVSAQMVAAAPTTPQTIDPGVAIAHALGLIDLPHPSR